MVADAAPLTRVAVARTVPVEDVNATVPVGVTPPVPEVTMEVKLVPCPWMGE